MSWPDVFPLLSDEMVACYEAEATVAEKAHLGTLFGIEKIFNKRESEHIFSTSLFWKPAWIAESDYPTPTRSLMENPNGSGLSSRFNNPWKHYVEPVLRAGILLKKERPEIALRVYLANDLSFAIEDLLQAGCEVFLMDSSSLRACPGTMWRFLAMEDGCLATITDSDQAENLLSNIERTELMAEGGLKYWRLPYFPGPGEINHGNPGWYRTTNACRFGAAVELSVRLLAEALLWNLEKGRINNYCTVGDRKIPIWGGNWPDYCFDEYFLNTSIFPRVAKEGVLTLLNQKDTSQNYWFSLDIEYCMKANSNSEIMHWGKPWRSDVPKFKHNEEDIEKIRNKLRGGVKENQPLISVCVSLKNRSRISSEKGELILFPNCVQSLAEINVAIGPIELIVADFSSDDWPLREWLNEQLGDMLCQVITLDGAFSRGRGINEAVRAARSEHLLLFDADMVMSQSAFIVGLSVLAGNTAFFPVSENLDAMGNIRDWYDDGFGLVFVPKTVWDAVGGVPEFNSWGGEDDLFYEKVAKTYPIERFRLEGLQHQWHPVSCRHENYSGTNKEDYQNHLNNNHGDKKLTGPSVPPIKF